MPASDCPLVVTTVLNLKVPSRPASILTPDEEVEMLTALGFIDLGSHPSATIFQLSDYLETPLCAIRIVAEIYRTPSWRKYHLMLYTNVYHAHGNELLVKRRVEKRCRA
ncbi:MAG: hypothetical protein FWD79_04430 [Desulfobulbus sp.]|nr:hypothetical protein [Desulfobulbus sp.]